MNRIVATVLSESGGLTFDDIKAENRCRSHSIPRQLIMYFCIEYRYSSTEVGKALSRSHATVLYGHRAVETWIEYPLSHKREMDVFNRVLTKLNQKQ